MPKGNEKPAIKVKRAYDAVADADGCRILVDRIWPRGVARDDLRLDDWVKEVAPSAELRKWFDHDRSKWSEFRKRYFRELAEQSEAVDALLDKARAGVVTLIFAARDTECNNAVALKEHLERRAGARAKAI